MHLRTLLVAAIVVLAGCSGAPGSPDSDAQTETEPTTTGPEAELTEAGSATNVAPNASSRASSTQDCAAVLYLEATEHPTNETALAYGNLSAERKAEFDMALVEGSAGLDESGDGYQFWVDRPYVEHDGNVYRSDVAVC